MFLGHYALGLAAKRASPRLSLGLLFLAVQFADILWPFLLALGLEEVRIHPGDTVFTPLEFVSYPYSHSLAMLIVWGLMFAAVFRPKVRLKADPTYAKEVDLYVGSGFSRTYTVLVLLVVSHWFLDWITHRPDMPLYPGGPKFGLGLWNSVAATVAIETAMYVAGLWIYIRSTRARDGILPPRRVR